MINWTKIVSYSLSIFFLIAGIINENLVMIIVSVSYFAFSYFNLGCLKQNCSIDDTKSK